MYGIEYSKLYYKIVLIVTLTGEDYDMGENIVIVIVGCLLMLVLGLQIQIRHISKKMDELLQKK
jgi:hypothetical protein